MKQALKTLEPNLLGRDFVVGDLHGAHAVFVNLLENLNFDGTKDRIISVGDLVDRGPESKLCLELLREPWFHCVLANHEQMMVEAFFGGRMGQYWFYNGGQWGMEAFREYVQLTHEQRQNPMEHLSPASADVLELIGLVKELPFLITVKMPDDKRFHVLHAELPPLLITDKDLEDEAKVRDFAAVQSHDGDTFLWGRWLYNQFFRYDFNNFDKAQRTIAYHYKTKPLPFNDALSHILSGHTIMRRPLTLFGGQTNLDTAAYCSYDDQTADAALTCVELGTWRFYQATLTEFREVSPVLLNIVEATEETV